MIYPTDDPELVGEKITDFLIKCNEADFIISAIVFEQGKIVKAELVV